MNREERERRVDGALERALGPHSIEPRLGFEERLLANLAAQPERRAWWRWMWVPALVAAAVIAIAIGMRVIENPPAHMIEAKHTPPHTVEKSPTVAELKPSPKPRRPAPVIAYARKHAVHVVLAKAEAAHPALPKQDVFPSPLPVTEQERLLQALVQRHPQVARQVADEQQAWHERIQKYLEAGDASSEPATAQQMR